MKKFVHLLAYLSWSVLIGATLTSCLHGNVYGLYDSIDEGGGGENGSGGSSGSSNTYQQDFQKEFGSISPSQNWNMSEEGEVTVSVSTSSTIYVYGTYTSGEYGSKLLGVFKDISGTQTLVFDKPSGLNSFYIVISNGLYTQGKTVTNGKSVSFSGSDDIDLTHSVTQTTKYVTVDPTVLQLLPNGTDNQGKTTQNSKFISDGKTISVTPVYSNCSYNNTIGIYVQGATFQEYDLWTKTTNFTTGTMEMPTFNLTLPADAIFGFYIKNPLGTFYSDASLNKSNARAASTLTVNDKTYIAFEDMPLNGDMDYNDMIIRVTPALTILDNDPNEWIIAAETDSNPDYDFNDVVFKISYSKGDSKLKLFMLNVGTQERMDLYLGTTLIGEIHNLAVNTLTSIDLNVPDDFVISENMGGFYLKAGDRTISPSGTGDAPRFLLIADGRWQWPGEGVNISTVYPDFKKWVNNPDAKWYTISETEIEDKSTADKDVDQGGNPDIASSEGPCTWTIDQFKLETKYAYWGYNTKTKQYMIYFTSFDVFKVVDLVNLELRVPSEATIVEFDIDGSESNSLPSGNYSDYDFTMFKSDVYTQIGIMFEQTNNESVLSVSKSGDTYTVIMQNGKLVGGDFIADSNTGEPIVNEHTYYPITLSYKGPLTLVPENYMQFMFYDEVEYRRIIVDE